MNQPSGQHGGWWQPPGAQQHPGTQQPPGFGGYSGHYGGFGAFEQSTPARRKRSKKPLLLGAAVAVLLAAGAVAAWLLGAFSGPVLDQAALEGEVTRVLHESYGEQDVTNTQCPAGQPIDPGHTFTCTVTVAGTPMTVRIRVLNEKPVFTIGAPHRS